MYAPVIRFAAPVVALAVSLGLAATQAAAEDKAMDRTVTVSATGSAVAVPDIAQVSTGVQTDAKTAREALTANSAAMGKLVAGLKSLGFDPKDIQTSNLSINPRYANPYEGQAPVIDGYSVINQVQITARNLDKLGEVLDTLVTLGANQMNGLSFEVSNAETLRDAARKDAIANALRRAKLYAEAAGADVGEVIAIAEDVTGTQPYQFKVARASMAEGVPVERGTQELEARVTVTWRMK